MTSYDIINKVITTKIIKCTYNINNNDFDNAMEEFFSLLLVSIKFFTIFNIFNTAFVSLFIILLLYL